MRAERRIRTLLLGWLLVPLALVLVASAIASYTTALRIATEAYDRALLDPALAIAQRLSAAEGKVELNYQTTASLDDIATQLDEAGINNPGPSDAEAFGRQLQVTSPDGLLIKINEIRDDI